MRIFNEKVDEEKNRIVLTLFDRDTKKTVTGVAELSWFITLSLGEQEDFTVATYRRLNEMLYEDEKISNADEV